MTSWLRPSKISPSVCRPFPPSNVYSFSTDSQGSSRRSLLSWSRRRVNSFSLTRCFFRAATHPSWLTTLRVVISCPPPSCSTPRADRERSVALSVKAAPGRSPQARPALASMGRLVEAEDLVGDGGEIRSRDVGRPPEHEGHGGPLHVCRRASCLHRSPHV